jgi:putative component of membrane protein insertase Oxa1/YidC/SpoIIIJ protein YidD
VASAVTPAWGNGRLVRALIRGYQQWLSRYTPACPSNPSCSAYALAAVEASGPRRGLAAAALRIRGCGT